MDYLEWFPVRLAQLRCQKGVSAREMSLDIGQSESYINQIENRKALPSLGCFFEICKYFRVEPKDFFTPQLYAPSYTARLMAALGQLKPHQSKHLLQLAKDLLDKYEPKGGRNYARGSNDFYR